MSWGWSGLIDELKDRKLNVASLDEVSMIQLLRGKDVESKTYSQEPGNFRVNDWMKFWNVCSENLCIPIPSGGSETWSNNYVCIATKRNLLLFMWICMRRHPITCSLRRKGSCIRTLTDKVTCTVPEACSESKADREKSSANQNGEFCSPLFLSF